MMLALASCLKRENPLSWNADWSAPMAYGSLTIGDLLPDSILTSSSDSSIILKFNTELFRFDMNELIGMADTVFRDTFLIPVFVPINFNPGQTIVNQPEENNLDLEGGELTFVKIKKGTLQYELSSSIKGDIVYTYTIQSAKDANGNVFTKTIKVPEAVNGVNTVMSGSFDLDGYTLDMRGANGNQYNKILTTMSFGVDANYPNPVSVSNQDAIYISNQFKDLKIDFAKGYFGSHHVETGWENTATNSFEKLISGNIDLEELSLKFKIENGIGSDAFIKIKGISSIDKFGNVLLLNNSIVGSNQILNRAFRIDDYVYPTLKQFDLNENNSNIIDMLTQLPKFLGFNFDITLNPLGNVSGHNDFIFDKSPLTLNLDAEMPLRFLANNLILQDTLSIDIADTSVLNSLKLTIEIENGFPLQAEIAIGILDQNDKIVSYVFAPSFINSGTLDGNGKVSQSSLSTHEVLISEKDMERLKAFKRAVLTVKFETPSNVGSVSIYDYYKLDYKIKANANVTISIN
jgi:hypothetical protein